MPLKPESCVRCGYYKRGTDGQCVYCGADWPLEEEKLAESNTPKGPEHNA